MTGTLSPYMILPALLAISVSVYAPIGGRRHQDLERLVALADVPTAKKPLSVALVTTYLPRIAATYPELYARIAGELPAGELPADGHRAIAFQELTLAGAAYDEQPTGLHHPLPNERGRTANGALAARARGYLRLNTHAQIALDAALGRREGAYLLDFPNTYVSLGWPWLQADLGYRDHWLSPADDSAIALSTNAVSSPSITIANSLPLTRARINYELVYSRLENTDKILFEDALHEGRPQMLAVHLSAAPWSWLVIGGNRVMQFGGGPREPVTLGEVLRAFFFPNRYDNVTSGGDRDDEFGNQLGSLVFAANHRIGRMPLRIYWEMGADDTGSQRIVYFGNPMSTVGIFLPCLTRDASLRYEFSEGQNRWYEHGIYQDGYRNDDRIMGHWMYEVNRERWPYETEASMHSLRMVTTTERHELSATMRVVSARSFSGVDFTTGVEMDFDLRQALSDRLDGLIRFYAGSTPRREQFGMLSLGLSLH
jgi:hypothetical protein